MALPSGTRNTFTYNGDGQRVQKQDSAGTTKHVWDGQNILLETDGSNIIQVVYTQEPTEYGNLLSQRRGGTSSFYLFDGLGSTWQLVNSTGSVTDSYLYDSFGGILLTSGMTSNPFKYKGRIGYYFDPDLADYYVRMRYLNPSNGRFFSRDPVAPEIPYATAYGYVRNNPSNLLDPSGMQIAPPVVAPLPVVIVVSACCAVGCAGYYVGTCLAEYTTLPLVDWWCKPSIDFPPPPRPPRRRPKDNKCYAEYNKYGAYPHGHNARNESRRIAMRVLSSRLRGKRRNLAA